MGTTRHRGGIGSFDDFEVVLCALEDLSREVKGSLGHYHLKMAMDHLAYSTMLPHRWISRWPVAPGPGTAKGLERLHGCPRPVSDPKTLETMLVEFYCRLRRDKVLAAKDFLGSVGASLCWQIRASGGAASGSTRYDYTTETSELELARLRSLGSQASSVVEQRCGPRR